MSSETKLTILGLYEYGQFKKDDLFKNIPEMTGIDRDLLINNILEKSASFECIYPEYDYMVFSIGIWWKKWERTFTKWVKALSIKYEPLNNFDRYEDYTDKGRYTENGKTTDGVNGSTEAIAENTQEVTAYNSDELRVKDRNTSSGTTKTKTDATSNTENEKINASYHKGHLYGNIGVTTSQQMLQSELDISRFNLIEQITDIFLQEYCIMVY